MKQILIILLSTSTTLYPIAANAQIGHLTAKSGWYSNTEHWLRADAITGLNDGDPVSTWIPQVYGNDAIQTGINRPLYKAGILNGKPVVRFDGTDDFYTDFFTMGTFKNPPTCLPAYRTGRPERQAQNYYMKSVFLKAESRDSAFFKK